MKGDPLIVLIDGDCALCDATAVWFARRNSAHRLIFATNTGVVARVAGEPPGLRHAVRERPQAAGVLQRIAGGDQPPHPVELEALHGEPAGGEMSGVRRVKRPAEQADTHAACVRGECQTGQVLHYADSYVTV